MAFPYYYLIQVVVVVQNLAHQLTKVQVDIIDLLTFTQQYLIITVVVPTFRLSIDISTNW